MQSYEQHMKRAIEEAELYLGATHPNPPVGALGLDANGRVLGVAAHQKAGEDHAEIALLKLPGVRENIHTLVVTLEPCVHQGKTGPCVAAIVEAGISSVVVGTLDPNPKVMGKGTEYLEKAGIFIKVGVLQEECQALIRSFQKYISTGLPWVAVKRALWEKDHSMLPPSGKKTFSSPEALRYAHERRKRADAIFTASGTVLADDPLFTVRHVEDHPNKERFLVLFDRRKRVPFSWIERAKDLGFQVLWAKDWKEAMEYLAQKGVMEVLVEAGPTFSNFVFKEKLWDEKIDIVVGEREEKILHRFQESH